MIALFASLVALAVGPLLYRLGRSMPAVDAALDGFALVAIGGLVLLDVLPDAFAAAGWGTLVVAGIGFFLPAAVERRIDRAAAGAQLGTLALAVAGLALHAALDGAALTHARTPLALSVVLHRLPVGLAIWIAIAPRRGTGTCAGVLAVLALATVIGYGVGGELFSGSALAYFQALVAGALLHVVTHRVSTAPDQPRPAWSTVGGLLAAGLLACMTVLHGFHAVERTTPIARAFVALAAESALPLLIAYLGAALLAVFMPRATVRWLGRGRAPIQAVRGMLFGLPLPVCSCGVIPLYRSLVTTGVPAAAAMAFLVATPELGVDAVLLSIPLLGSQMTVARVASAALVAFLAGWIVGRKAPAPAPSTADAARADRGQTSLAARLRRAMTVELAEIVDGTGPWIVLGLAIAAVGATVLDGAWLRQLPWGVDVVACAFAGIPTYVCAAGATPLVAMLIAKGVSPGAALAFLLTGPATNATTFGVLSALHGRRVALFFGLVVAVLAIGAGLLTNVLLPRPDVFSFDRAAAALSPWQTAAMAALGLLFALSLLRLGTRGFIGRVWALADPVTCDCPEHSGVDQGCCGAEPPADGACGCAGHQEPHDDGDPCHHCEPDD